MELAGKIPVHTTGGQAQDAAQIYRRMQLEGLKPDTYGFVRILQSCGKSRDLVLGRQLHREIVRHGYDSNLFVGTSIVDMYAKCGSMEDAQSVFDGLTQSDVVSWNAMIAGYVQEDRHYEALQLYGQMQDRGVSPNHRTFPIVLKACAGIASSVQETLVDGQRVKLQCLEKGKEIHADIVKRGYEANVFVASSLVHMFAKCGDLVRAKSVFENLPQHDVVSWTAMIGGYVQQHQGEKAWHLYCQMQEKGVKANIMTFTTVFKACEMMAAIEDKTVVGGQALKVQSLSRLTKLQLDLAKSNSELDALASNTLVKMHAQCGDLSGARRLFDRLPKCNLVAWNALIAGYAQLEEIDKAWQVYSEMVGSLVEPDTWTFVSLLKACGILAAREDVTLVDGRPVKRQTLKYVEEIHAEVVRTGCDSDCLMGTTLVDLYSKCGNLSDARRVFNQLTKRDVVSWTAMISGYAQHQPDEALDLYEEMKVAGERPDSWTLASLLKACGSLAGLEDVSTIDGQPVKVQSLQKLKELHADVLKCCDEVDVILGTTLVDAYASCGSLADAKCVFDTMSKRDVFLWTSMMAGYTELGGGEIALQLYAEMVEAGVTPDKWTFVSMLKACASLASKEKYTLVDGQAFKVEALHKGKQTHVAMAISGCDTDLIVGTTLVDMYAKCGDLLSAKQLFDVLPHHDVVLWNAMMAGYAQHQQSEEALQLHSKMQHLGVRPDQATYACILKASSDLGALQTCKQIEQEIMSSGVERSPSLSTSLIHSYGKCSSMVDAQHVFDTSPCRNLAAWNALIAGYAKQGECTSSLHWFEEMQKAGIRPDAVTFLSVLAACSHAGLVDKGIQYFKAMLADHGITPRVEHYTCLVDLLGRAGLLQQVEDLVEAMHLQPDPAVWLCLLRACRTYGNVEVAQRAFSHAVELDEQQSSAYILMTSIYAQHRMWEDARNTEAMRRQVGAWKKPGRSWIEDGKGLAKFRADRNTDTSRDDVKSILEGLSPGLTLDA